MVTPDLCKTSYAFAFHHGTKTPDLALIMDKIDRGFWVPAAGYDASLVHRLLWFIVCLIHSRCFVYPCSRIFFLCRFSSAIVRHNLWRDLFLLKDAQSAIDMELFQHTVCFNYSVHVLAWFCEKKRHCLKDLLCSLLLSFGSLHMKWMKEGIMVYFKWFSDYFL